MEEIYIAATPTQLSKGLVKVGFTTRGAEKRVKESNTTALEENYELHWSIKSPHSQDCETYIHNHFTRLRKDREFVFATPEEAKAEILSYLQDKDEAVALQISGEKLFNTGIGVIKLVIGNNDPNLPWILPYLKHAALTGEVRTAMDFKELATEQLQAMEKESLLLRQSVLKNEIKEKQSFWGRFSKKDELAMLKELQVVLTKLVLLKHIGPVKEIKIKH